MVKVAVMLAQGFEEIEALTVVDVLRRANITCDMVGFEEQVTGSHAIQVTADRVFDGDLSDYDMVVLPGGMPGSAHLRDNQALVQELQSFEQEGKKLAAICAAPIALNQAGILKNKQYTCYDGVQEKILDASTSLAMVAAKNIPNVDLEILEFAKNSEVNGKNRKGVLASLEAEVRRLGESAESEAEAKSE